MVIDNKYKIIGMISLLILLPILLSIVATQYETCHIIKRNCKSTVSKDYLQENRYPELLDEVSCRDTKPDATEPVYKDLNTDKCYGYVAQHGSSPPPPSAILIWIGKNKETK